MAFQRRGSEWRSAARPVALVAAVATTLALLGGVPSLNAERADLFDEIYKLGQAKNGALTTLTASFVETSTSTLLTKPLVASGVVAVERPSRIALRYNQPEERIVLIEGNRMTMTWPSRNVRESKDIGAAQGRIQKYFVDSSPGELRSHFSVSAREADDGPNSYLVTLDPKRKQIKEGLTRLELWVDKTSLLMAAMRMTFPNGDSKLMTFTDVKANLPVDKTMFSVPR